MDDNTSKQAPADLPAIGSKVKIQCNDADCPAALVKRGPEVVKGWNAFFAGEPDPEPNEEFGPFGEYDKTNQFAVGWKTALRHKAYREAYDWTLSAIEDGEDGGKVAVLTREEVNSLDDVYNGSGTGLGTHTVTERVNLS